MWPAIEPYWPGLALILMAWVWGSFLNQLVDRMPGGGGGTCAYGRPEQGASPQERGASARGKSAQPARVSLLRPVRSICLDCGAGIPWYDNIPVVSYLLLRGSCRRCAAPIGVRTLVMEVATPAAFAGLYLLRPAYGTSLLAVPWLAALEYLLLSWLLLAAALLVERRRLEAGMVIAGVGLGLVWLLLSWRM